MGAQPITGVGFLVARDILTDCSYQLFEPIVNTALPAAIGAGWQVIAAWDPSLYVGALVVVGAIGSPDVEVVAVAAVTPGTSFQAKFANAHAAGETITAPTFPVQQASGDYFFTQSEMLGYLSNAVNDFLVKVPLVYAVTNAIKMPATQQITALPADCMFPVRIASAGRSLRETSQSRLDAMNYRWESMALAPPTGYFRDKVGLQNFGIYPRSSDVVPFEITYAQRGPQTMGLADGFLLPDPFLRYVKFRVLSFAFSKDGEQRSPAMAKYFDDKFETGCAISQLFLEAMVDPNAR